MVKDSENIFVLHGIFYRLQPPFYPKKALILRLNNRQLLKCVKYCPEYKKIN